MATKEEILDVLDYQTGDLTGQTIERKTAHQKGVPHKAIHLWLVTDTAEGPAFYLQRRSLKKPNFPGIFVASVGGHILAGEGVESMVREAEEEIGFPLDLSQVEYLDYHPFELLLPHYQDYEWIEEYLVRTDWKLEDFTFPDGEVIGMAQILQKDLKILAQNPQGKIPGHYFDGDQTQEWEFGAESFITNFLTMNIIRKLIDWGNPKDGF